MVHKLTYSLQIIGLLDQLLLIDIESRLHNLLHEGSLYSVLH